MEETYEIKSKVILYLITGDYILLPDPDDILCVQHDYRIKQQKASENEVRQCCITHKLPLCHSKSDADTVACRLRHPNSC